MPQDYKKLNRLINSLSEAEQKSDTRLGKLSERSNMESITFFPENFTYTGKKVQKIYFLGPHLDPDVTGHLMIHFEDRSHIVINFSGYQFGLRKELIKLGGIPEYAFIHNQKKAMDWSTMKNFSYSDTEQAFYSEMYFEIPKILLKEIEAKFRAKASKDGVLIIALGCGKGQEVRACYEKLKEANYPCSAIGVDINPELTKANQTNCANPDLHYMTADIQNMELLLDKIQGHIGNKVVAFVALGSITRFVIDGTYPALKIFQELALQQIGDVVISTGMMDSVITRHGLEAAGWQLHPRCYQILDPEWASPPYCLTSEHNDWCRDVGGTFKVMYLCFQQSKDEQFQATLLRSAENSNSQIDNFPCLDLENTSNPVEQIEQFISSRAEQVAKITKINLSWSCLKLDLTQSHKLPKIIQLLSQFHNLTRISIANCEPWAGDFISQVSKHKNHFKIDSLQIVRSELCVDENEIRRLPISISSELGISPPGQEWIISSIKSDSKQYYIALPQLHSLERYAELPVSFFEQKLSLPENRRGFHSQASGPESTVFHLHAPSSNDNKPNLQLPVTASERVVFLQNPSAPKAYFRKLNSFESIAIQKWQHLGITEDKLREIYQKTDEFGSKHFEKLNLLINQHILEKRPPLNDSQISAKLRKIKVENASDAPQDDPPQSVTRLDCSIS